ncbi:MFS transporter [Terrarubrum flagellatum]|uniref:MFS transporter n=1 Tax=Terrirubrum flagellatum TaxID=2895980 RepID=UPI003144E16F
MSSQSVSIFPRLLAASSAMHAADQMTLAAVPLIAAAAGADARTIGLLVAAQSAAWLLLSLPIGALADRFSRRTILLAGGALALIGSITGWLALHAPGAPLALIGAACFVTAAGVVAIVLSVFALMPRIVETKGLPRANSRLELMRAIVTLAAPAPATWLVAHGSADIVFVATAVFGLGALIACWPLPADKPAAPAQPMLTAIREGARFVAGHHALRAIALCAIFWNMAFFALTALFVPFATSKLGLEPQAIGRMWSALGAGLVLSALFAPAITARVSLGGLLMFGPLVSFIAIGVIATASRATPEPMIWAAFFLIGFGPMLWAVTQTSLRQAITPQPMMGRVGATMQAANYGARPIGALLAGWLGATVGVGEAMLLPAILFTLSLASMAWLLRATLAAATAETAQAA